MMKIVRNLVLIFVFVVLLGFLSLTIAYCLPRERIHNKVVDKYDSYFPTYQLLSGYDTTGLDLYTDAIILGETACYNKNKSLINNVVSVYGPNRGVNEFVEYSKGDESMIADYARYWHGNLIILKPLFLFFDYNSIRLIGLFVQILMIIVIAKLMKKNKIEKYIAPFIISLFMIHPEVISLSLQYSAMYNLLLVSLIILLGMKDYLFKKNRLVYFYLIIGMLTSFFDFLTFPAITFGVPIVFTLLLDNNKKIKATLIKIILYGIIWSIGYVGMWLSKWIITSIVLNKNAIKQALNIIFYRSSTDAEFSRLDAITRNLSVYNKLAYIIIFISIAIYYIVRIFINRKSINKEKIINVIPLICISLIPFVWYFIISNHSYIHYWMTYRELVIFFFATLCGCEYMLDKDRSKKYEKRK